MDFTFACAKPLYQEKCHPRLLVGGRDLPGLRQTVGRGDGRKILQAFRAKVQESVAAIHDRPDDAELMAFIGAPRTPGYTLTIGRLHDMGMLAWLEADARVLDACARLLTLCPGIEGGEAQARLRLGCAAGGQAGMAFDFIAEDLEPPVRRRIAHWLYHSGVKQTLSQLGPAYFHCPGSNIPMTRLINAMHAMLAIDGEPGVPSLDRAWRQTLPMFEATLESVVGVDGYPTEDTGYGTLMMARVMVLGEILRRAGRIDPWTASPRYGKFGRAVLHLVQPWGEHLTTTGDHGDDFGQRSLPLARCAQETGDPALLWLAGTLCYPTHGKATDVALRRGVRVPNSICSLLFADQFRQAKHPLRAGVPTAYHDRDRGVVSFRSGWDTDATYLFFDGSQRPPVAHGHHHASCGHFCLSALGDYFAVGPGRYNMDQENQSVVLINGKSGRGTNGEWREATYPGQLTAYRPGAFVDSAAADSSHQHNGYWAWRTIGLVKGKGMPSYVWTMDDINANDDWAEYWWQLHASPESRIRVRKTGATITGWLRGNHLDVHFMLPEPDEYPRAHTLCVAQDEVLPSSHKYVSHEHSRERANGFARPAEQIHYSTFVAPRLLGKVAGYNGCFITLMLPRRDGDAPLRVSRLKSLPGTIAVRVVGDTVEDVLVFSFGHNLLRAADIDLRGKWCVQRRDRKTGRVLASELAD